MDTDSMRTAGRRERQAAEERALECTTLLARERQSLLEQSSELRRRTAAELATTRQEAEAKMEDMTGNLRAQVTIYV